MNLGAFDRRLAPTAAAPVAIAFSGGGDSLAALLLTKAWADRIGRPLIALTVDHGLQAASAAWTAFAGQTTARLGVPFRALAWTGEKPSTGLPAAARAARHQLLADAAREAGARVIVTGHTADDELEGEIMRDWGSTLGRLREWSPSPVWPEGRGLFLLRPLLGERRTDLRRWLVERGERWIDDPANADPAQTRARARLALAGGGEAEPPPAEDTALNRLAEATMGDASGALALDRDRLRAAPVEAAMRWLAAASVCAGGGARLPRTTAVQALTERLRRPEPVRATLCGARILGSPGEVMIVRDAGERRRGRLAPQALAVGEPAVWDGRFELTARRPGLSAEPLAGLAARLPRDEKRALQAIPAPPRPALPALTDAAGAATCPVLAPASAAIECLVLSRLKAACGVIGKEPAA